ncbi:S41 family peptidase [Acinetobacter indicus]|uniref:S41 family peptidase n=1 Tax=Acinetobacter indicus TaxID=756892 RepID=UPI00159F522A|nr:S41 family peptidase [Acinetobacter indicus]MDM1304777.1 S41 family peptidase [Acinetobacter indicus]QLB58284.1 S41 family peptidase [Acinetobacter indicus]
MVPHWKRMLVATTLMMCVNLPVWAAEDQDPLALEETTEQDYVEVPVESIQQFVKIYGLVKANYVTEKSDEALFAQAIQGLVSGLDQYSRYLKAEDYRALVQYTEGDLASVDFNLRYDAQQHQWQIHNLRPDADSAKQGLRNGISVFKIDNQELQKLNQDQVNALLMGAVGSNITLQLTASAQPIRLVRNRKVETDIQAQMLSNQVLLIKVKVFQQDTANEIKELIEQYSTPRLKAVLFDLRNNPGGLLSSAVESADLFLNQGVIVSTKSRAEGDQQFQALPSFEFQNLKVGVLINQRSASAAEVFTAALKDHGRAWVIGEKSYGKGVVQKLFPLSDGTALQMTVSHYYTPQGKMIEGVGIEPNQRYALQQDMKEDNYLDHVAELLLSHK